MTSVDDVTNHIDSTAPVLDTSLGKAMAASADTEQVVTGLTTAKDDVEKLAKAFANLGAAGKADQATRAAGQAEELTGSAQVAQSMIDSSVDRLGKLKNDLKDLRAQVEALRGLLHEAIGTGEAPPSATAPPEPLRPAGTWVPTPGGTRRFGHPFNQEYEEWVRTSTGGPAAGSEYLVEGNGKKVYFDATVVETRDGVPTEVLIDAKGRYAQFVDKKSGEFHGFFRAGGAKNMIKDAERQAAAADGRPVEWWCAEEEAADAFEFLFADVGRMDGRLEAVYKPMPGSERLGCCRELEAGHCVEAGGFGLGG